ncbi:hypothetical protein [Haloarcula sp. 1CSR25-25]|uniref:hypothetical protein n=1 Tax=Haloarcula sp. 1CSR25-25 TaxID=2862545 RepID=UPI0028961ECE|nr:hypothetical protein [Haloarcula sp. 1CSR25-25]MDT3434673.1 hypothetical protein [Haloarcula sp. 1CSR25-25]
MKDTKPCNKKATDTTADEQRIKQIAALVHEMRTKGCQVIDVVGEAEADPSMTVTEPKREARRLIGQLGGVLGDLAEEQGAAEAAASPDGTDEAETDGGLGGMFGEADDSTEESDLRGFE